MGEACRHLASRNAWRSAHSPRFPRWSEGHIFESRYCGWAPLGTEHRRHWPNPGCTWSGWWAAPGSRAERLLQSSIRSGDGGGAAQANKLQIFPQFMESLNQRFIRKPNSPNFASLWMCRLWSTHPSTDYPSEEEVTKVRFQTRRQSLWTEIPLLFHHLPDAWSSAGAPWWWSVCMDQGPQS